MRRSNPKTFANQVLGSLKKQHGAAVQVYQMVSSNVDRASGVRSSVSTCTEVDNCIILPAKVTSEVSQSISYISAAKPFIMGGFYATGKRNFIFDFAERRGLPVSFEWSTSDWIIVENTVTGRTEKYDVEKFEELYFGSGWLVTGNRVTGVSPQRSVKESITHTLQLRLNSTITAVVE